MKTVIIDTPDGPSVVLPEEFMQELGLKIGDVRDAELETFGDHQRLVLLLPYAEDQNT